MGELSSPSLPDRHRTGHVRTGRVNPPPLGISDGVGALLMLCSEFVPEDKREQSIRVGSFTKTLRILPINGPRANQLSLRTAPTAGTPKSLLPAPHPARASREKGEDRESTSTAPTGGRDITHRNEIYEVEEQDLMWSTTGHVCDSLCKRARSGGASGRRAGAQRTHHCGVGRMRFLFPMSHRLSLSEEMLSTPMNIEI